MKDLKKYDKLLRLKKNIDGSKVIFRDSPFSSQKSFDIITIENQYLGSLRWALTCLTLMDTRKFDIVGRSMRNNMAIRNRREDDRITRDISEFWEVGGQSILT